MIFLRSVREIMPQINASDGALDNDEALLQHIEAIEALLQHIEVIEAFFGVNTKNGGREGNSKDQDKSREPFDAGCGVNPASVFPRQHSFSEQEK